ncbi:hypothetical protein J5N97_027928 [Dioscorea zingiberensis]|uniref:Uncharacterized protein n=1 Tax=Dioscorea zingiberensis TaxID=325984 RepID=A0A9D5H4F5_9LILI|nr:hypothetical protein J5N97_027928 [Dioscorea zingiberensis]
MGKLSFSVVIGKPELISPESQTPAEFKYLSNLDDQPGFRSHMPFIHYYNQRRAGERRDPATVIRRALSKALVRYYPLAGRLRHGEKGKLVVDCCAEGVVFREADADVTLDRLKLAAAGGLRPPSPFLSKFLLDDIWGSAFVIDSPLLRMQVTRLKCGGFVLAYTVNHCMCDGYGVFQFITAVSELAREPNRSDLTQPPVWARELLTPRSPPRPSFPHREYDPDPNMEPDSSGSEIRDKTQISIFFTRSDISALKSQINGPKTPTFVAITALLWRAWTRSLGLRSETRLLVPIDTRGHHQPLLPVGYYGVAVVVSCAVAPAKELVSRPISFAGGLISELKSRGSDKEYRASTVDFIETERRFWCRGEGTLVVTDVSKLRFADVDFGWGPGLYGGFARGGVVDVAGLVVTTLSGYKREEDGVEGLVALLSLPREAVDAFQDEVHRGIAFRSALL